MQSCCEIPRGPEGFAPSFLFKERGLQLLDSKVMEVEKHSPGN